jgi:hypothetical protein
MTRRPALSYDDAIDQAPISTRQAMPWPPRSDADDSFEPPWLAEFPSEPPAESAPVSRPTNPYTLVGGRTSRQSDPPGTSTTRRYDSERVRAHPPTGAFVAVEEIVVRTTDPRFEE